MTEPLTELPRTSANGTLARATKLVEAEDLPVEAEADIQPTDESPPSTPRWVKVLGILLVVLFLAFAGMHLTGNAPTHMAGGSAAQHGMQLP